MRVTLDRPELLPGDEVVATVVLDKALDRVASARVELGFDNVFSYRWAGHRDAALAVDPLTLEQNYGGDKDTTEWVSVVGEDVPFVDERLDAGERQYRFRVPSWAPPSSPALARWAVRVAVPRRRGRDAGAEADLVVLAPRPAIAPADLEQRTGDDFATALDVRLDDAAVRPGGTVRGTITLTPAKPVRVDTLTMLLYRDRLSHPVNRNAGLGQSGWKSRHRLTKGDELPEGRAVVFSFELEVPKDAEPTGEAPSSTIRWWVEGSLIYKGLVPDDPTDRVRREVIVFNAP
jgi:hypothetical protein